MWAPLQAHAPVVALLHPSEVRAVLAAIATKGQSEAKEAARVKVMAWVVEAEQAIVEAVTAYRSARQKAARVEKAARAVRREERAAGCSRVPRDDIERRHDATERSYE